MLISPRSTLMIWGSSSNPVTRQSQPPSARYHANLRWCRCPITLADNARFGERDRILEVPVLPLAIATSQGAGRPNGHAERQLCGAIEQEATASRDAHLLRDGRTPPSAIVCVTAGSRLTERTLDAVGERPPVAGSGSHGHVDVPNPIARTVIGAGRIGARGTLAGNERS